MPWPDANSRGPACIYRWLVGKLDKLLVKHELTSHSRRVRSSRVWRSGRTPGLFQMDVYSMRACALLPDVDS